MSRRLLCCGLVLGLGAGFGGCFTGEATIGAYCEGDRDCGPEQRCTNSVCGQCGDDMRRSGELCLGERVDVTAPEGTRWLRPMDLDGDRRYEVFAAVQTQEQWSWLALDPAGEVLFGGAAGGELRDVARVGTGIEASRLAVLDAQHLTLWSMPRALDAGGEAEVEAGGEAEVEAGGEAEVDAGGEAEVEAGGEAEVEAEPRLEHALEGAFAEVETLSPSLLVLLPVEPGPLMLVEVPADGGPPVLRSSAVEPLPGARLSSTGAAADEARIAVYGADGTVLLLAATSGELEVVASIDAGAPLEDLVLADATDDGRIDVVASRDGDMIVWEAPRFAVEQVLARGLAPAAIAIADVDHDDVADVLVTSATPHLRVAPRRTGAVSFHHAFDLPAPATGLVVADLDRNFRVDVLPYRADGWSWFNDAL